MRRSGLSTWTAEHRALRYLIERTSDVDGTVLDDFVHHLRDGLSEVRVGKLNTRVKVAKRRAD